MRVQMGRQPELAEECSMCGDVGFPEELFRCHTCHKRVQHRYCSRWYPKLSPQAHNWACEWCLSSAVAADSNSKKPIMSATPIKAAQLPNFIAADDPKSKKNCSKRSCLLLDQLHQAGRNGVISKRRRKSNSQSIVAAGAACPSPATTTASTANGAQRFRSLQDLLCPS